MAARHVETANLKDAAGKIHVAWKYQNIVTSQGMSGTHSVGGTVFWQFPNGHSLDTDDDVEFTDTNGRVYRRVE